MHRREKQFALPRCAGAPSGPLPPAFARGSILRGNLRQPGEPGKGGDDERLVSFSTAVLPHRRRIAVALSAAAGAPGAPAAVHRLSDGQAFSTVELGYSKPALTPDGERVVYCQNAETAGAFALWSVRLAGGAPVRLSGALAGGGLACWFRISPDGSQVVYLANQDAPATYELYSVPVDGSALAVKLNPALVGNGNVSSLFEISPDSATVIYRADQVADDRFDLWTVPIGGGAAVKVNGVLNADGDVSSFVISPNGLHVVYLADQDDDELFTSSVRRSAAGLVVRRRSEPDGGDIFEYRFTRTAHGSYRRADIVVDDRFELYRIATDGSLAAYPVRPGCRCRRRRARLRDLAGRREVVVYLADLDIDGVVELFGFPPTATTPTTTSSSTPTWRAAAMWTALSLISPAAPGRLRRGCRRSTAATSSTRSSVRRRRRTPTQPGSAGFSNVAFDPLIPPDSARDSPIG